MLCCTWPAALVGPLVHCRARWRLPQSDPVQALHLDRAPTEPGNADTARARRNAGRRGRDKSRRVPTLEHGDRAARSGGRGLPVQPQPREPTSVSTSRNIVSNRSESSMLDRRIASRARSIRPGRRGCRWSPTELSKAVRCALSTGGSGRVPPRQTTSRSSRRGSSTPSTCGRSGAASTGCKCSSSPYVL